MSTTEKTSDIKIGKYGTMENFLSKLHPDEPWFVFRAQDTLLPAILKHYAELLHEAKAEPDMIGGILIFEEKVRAWQQDNKDKVKVPD